MKKIVVLILCAVLLMSVNALAEDTCAQECPEGKVLVTFADGNNLTCTCVDASEGMVEGPAGCQGGDCDAPNENSQQGS